ncbi:hypothetical protein MRV_0028 [Murid herpesvirus 3]|uniref:Uncharacterized protein n=2 Tax=Murid betaherpesvirus 3 TaxID=2560603 RepID=A0A1P8VIR0_9BETA|nr:hypothetical protein MRV_0028 [Murine roseolovirus]APZ76239.1 hypothetical protein MRV_0028 [Murid betaherpesvirus 3]AYH64739.1 hypothetical protein MRV_0028 [Murid herpesvirus 3]
MSNLIQIQNSEKILRKRLHSYDQLLNHILTQYQKTMLTDNTYLKYKNGKFILKTVFLNIGDIVIVNNISYGWVSVTLPKITALKELYFFIVSPENDNITFNPTISKGGWLSGTYSFKNDELLFKITGNIGKLHLYLFVPYLYPDIFVAIEHTCNYDLLQDIQFGNIKILNKTGNTFIGVLSNLTWCKQYTNTNNQQVMLRAYFTGEWNDELPITSVFTFYNNTNFVFLDYNFTINFEKIIITKDTKKIIGSISTTACQLLPDNLKPENLPISLIIQFAIEKNDNKNIIFSCNPKIYFSGDALNNKARQLNEPNLYELTVHATHDLHFNPSKCHIIKFPISYTTVSNHEILIGGVSNDGIFETQIAIWKPGELLSIVLRSFSNNLILLQGTAIATLYYVNKMTTNNQKTEFMSREEIIDKNIFINNLLLTKENFLHYDSE